MVKALGLLSGGLDSRLAIKLIIDQGIDVETLHFKLPFEGCCLPDCAFKFSQVENLPLHIIDATKGKEFQEYIKLVRKPRHGYGSKMNPCVDCRVFMLKKAKKLAKKIKADFIFTGEVLGERPMTQTKRALELIERKSRLTRKIVRPLSGKLLPKTEAERKGLIKRENFLAIQGRKRKPQFDLAKKYKLENFPMPGGGCILCEKEFSLKIKDLLKHKRIIKPKDIELLRLGRHFRFKNNKIIVGRNQLENELLTKLKQKSDYIFEVLNYGSPITILQGPKTKEAITLSAKLTASHSDSKEKRTSVKYGKNKLVKTVKVSTLKRDKINKLRI